MQSKIGKAKRTGTTWNRKRKGNFTVVVLFTFFASLRPLPCSLACLCPEASLPASLPASRGAGSVGTHPVFWSLQRKRNQVKGEEHKTPHAPLHSLCKEMTFLLSDSQTPAQRAPAWASGPQNLPTSLPSLLVSIPSVSYPEVLHAPLSTKLLPTPLVPNPAFSELEGKRQESQHLPPNTSFGSC